MSGIDEVLASIPPVGADDKSGDALKIGVPEQPEKRKPGRPKGSTSRASLATLKQQIDRKFHQLGDLVSLLNPDDGAVFHTVAPLWAEGLTDLAEQNRKAREWLEKAMRGGTYGTLFTAFLMTLVPLAVNHGLVPESLKPMLGLAPEEPSDDANADSSTSVVA